LKFSVRVFYIQAGIGPFFQQQQQTAGWDSTCFHRRCATQRGTRQQQDSAQRDAAQPGAAQRGCDIATSKLTEEVPCSESPASIKMPLSEVPLSQTPRSEASASSGVPLSETPTPRGAIIKP